LSELIDDKIIVNKNDEYYVINKKLRKEYESYFREEITILDLPIMNDIITGVIDGIKPLLESNNPESKFLESKDLSSLSKEIIRNAKHEVIVMNPFVKQCPLSETLKDARKNNAQVTIIMRSSKYEIEQLYYETLKTVGIKILYDDTVHAKMIVVDQKIAIVSSMNFFHKSSEGGSYEAGYYTKDDNEIEKIRNAILKRINE